MGRAERFLILPKSQPRLPKMPDSSGERLLSVSVENPNLSSQLADEYRTASTSITTDIETVDPHLKAN
jgi:hypothetical protein